MSASGESPQDKVPEGKKPASKGVGCGGIVAAVVVLLVVLGAAKSCDGGSGSSTAAAPDKYQQTWAKSYGDTTCNDWLSSMQEGQKFAAAADMLAGARSKDGATGLPSDDLVRTFEGGVTTACVEPTMTITDIAVGLYLTERTRFAP